MARKMSRKPGKPGRKPLGESEKMVKVTIRVPPDVLEFIDGYAAPSKRHLRSALMFKAIILYLDVNFGTKFYLKYFAPRDKIIL